MKGEKEVGSSRRAEGRTSGPGWAYRPGLPRLERPSQAGLHQGPYLKEQSKNLNQPTEQKPKSKLTGNMVNQQNILQ